MSCRLPLGVLVQLLQLVLAERVADLAPAGLLRDQAVEYAGGDPRAAGLDLVFAVAADLDAGGVAQPLAVRQPASPRSAVGRD
ncbi:MAG: hypothetical protein U5P41_07270 [Gammaproteobacteria bacterium]|nr:hypothetical protein [Gammaproteobacteria bacterium]